MRKIEGYNIEYDFSGFRKIADLVYLDGPFLSHYVSSKGDDYLFYWVDKDNHDNRWLVLRVSLSSLQKYIGKELSLRELIDNPNDGYLYSVDVDKDFRDGSMPTDYMKLSGGYDLGAKEEDLDKVLTSFEKNDSDDYASYSFSNQAYTKDVHVYLYQSPDYPSIDVRLENEEWNYQ